MKEPYYSLQNLSNQYIKPHISLFLMNILGLWILYLKLKKKSCSITETTLFY